MVMSATNDSLDRAFMAGDGGDGREEYVSDSLVKFLMSRNVPLDAINDSHFRTLLQTIAQHGQQSCILLENPTVIQRSLWKFEHEIKQYMKMVMESWKTTGCTVMSYNLRVRDQNKGVVGFYCPKGFIFVEVGPSIKEVENTLKNLVSDSSYSVWNNVIQFFQHDSSHHSECQYQAIHLNGAIYQETYMYNCADEAKCIRQQILVLWEVIRETSKWVQGLTKKSDQIYEYIVTTNFGDELYTTLKHKGVERVASSFARLGVVMKVELEMRAWLSQLSEDERFRLDVRTDIASIINNNEFWRDGKELLRVLNPLFKIPRLLDTLVPTAGYLGSAIDEATGLLKTYSASKCLKYEDIWKCFETWRSNFHSVQDLSDYLSPAHIVRQGVQDNLEGGFEPYLYSLAGEDDVAWLYNAGEDVNDEAKVLDPEIEAYCIKSSNPFANLSVSECEANHPVTLWSKYGGGFPLLQKCAYKLLSQPACCLCKQVEKHVPKLQGVDNYILRLNALMMEEFTKMGDAYRPIHI